MDDKKEEEKNTKKERVNLGCAIMMFLFIAAGIPIALSDEQGIRFLGEFPTIIGGIAIAYFMARGVYRAL